MLMSMLCCIGDLVEDVVVWLSAEPQHGTDTPARVFRSRGGSAATVAVCAVAAGVRARFVGQIGDDPLGTSLVAQMEAAGVEVQVVRSGRTGSIVVLVEPGGERTMLPDRAAATELAVLPEGALREVRWLHVPAYSLFVEPLATTSIAAVNEACLIGIPVSIDASSAGDLSRFGVDRFLELMTTLEPDVFFCNEDEAGLLGVVAGDGISGPRLTIVKAGPGPVTLIDAGGGTKTVPVPAVEVVSDTTGAGDAFAAGFIAASMGGADPVAATDAGSRMAATVLTRPGAGT